MKDLLPKFDSNIPATAFIYIYNIDNNIIQIYKQYIPVSIRKAVVNIAVRKSRPITHETTLCEIIGRFVIPASQIQYRPKNSVFI